MKKSITSLLSVLLILAMLAGCFASCDSTSDDGTEGDFARTLLRKGSRALPKIHEG